MRCAWCPGTSGCCRIPSGTYQLGCQVGPEAHKLQLHGPANPAISRKSREGFELGPRQCCPLLGMQNERVTLHRFLIGGAGHSGETLGCPWGCRHSFLNVATQPHPSTPSPKLHPCAASGAEAAQATAQGNTLPRSRGQPPAPCWGTLHWGGDTAPHGSSVGSGSACTVG